MNDYWGNVTTTIIHLNKNDVIKVGMKAPVVNETLGEFLYDVMWYKIGV